jgi:hypothetical protein
MKRHRSDVVLNGSSSDPCDVYISKYIHKITLKELVHPVTTHFIFFTFKKGGKIL